MPIHIFRILFPKETKEQLAATKNESCPKNIQQNNNSTIKYLLVTINHKNKQKLCRFFVLPRKGHILLGMPDIETLYALTIKCNTVDTQKQSMHTYSVMEDECQYTKMHREHSGPIGVIKTQLIF